MRQGVLLLLLMTVSPPALAIHERESHGHVTYTDIPCGATQSELPPAAGTRLSVQ